MDYSRRSYDSLREAASAFLGEHHPSGEIPIPIEQIVDFKLELEIVPVAGLQEEFEVEGFLALGRHAIYVDEGIMIRRPGRYRFTLAYETCRFLLQESLCPKDVATVRQFLEWHRQLPLDVLNESKYESYDFGGLILVPPNHLQREFARAREKVDRMMGRSHWEHRGFLWSGIVQELALKFDVSTEVVKKRLERDKLLPPGVRL